MRIPPAIGHLLWPLFAIGIVLSINLIDFSVLRLLLAGETTEDSLLTLSFFVPQQEGQRSGLTMILIQGVKIVVLAMGMTLVIASRGVDLSVGSILAVACAVSALLMAHWGTNAAGNLIQLGFMPIALIMLATLCLCMLAGAWNGALVAYVGVQPIVATLVLMVAGRGIAQLLAGGQVVFIKQEKFLAIGDGTVWGVPNSILVALGVFAVTAAVTRLTAFGLFIESVGSNTTASRYAGIRTRLITMSVYAYSGLCAGIAGLMLAAYNKSADPNNAGLYLELDAILAVVVGGTSLMGGRFFLLGSLVGALLIQTMNTTIYYQGFGVEYTLVVKALVILIVCLMQSSEFRQAVLRPFSRLRMGKPSKAAVKE